MPERPPLIFYPMTQEDIPSIVAMEEVAQLSPWSAKNFQDALAANYLCYIAKLDERIVAYFILMCVLDQSEILNLTVASPLQNQGLGRQLLEKIRLLAWQRKIASIYLEVRASNQAALRLYHRFGFQLVGQRPGYYATSTPGLHEDAYHMRLDLDLENP